MVSAGDPSGETATLVISDDSALCSACGGGARSEENHQMTILPRAVAGGFVPLSEGRRAGCGATFIASATESPMPGVGELMRQTRPDLPFMGVSGIDGCA